MSDDPFPFPHHPSGGAAARRGERVKEQTQQLIGKVLNSEGAERDAIHIAVAPVVAHERLFPGQHVGLWESGEASNGCAHIGIVDPFLTEGVFPGQRFFLFLYPNTITSLRHVWTHPAFAPQADPGYDKAASEAWLRHYAEVFDLSYSALLEVGRRWVEEGEYHVLSHDTPDEAYSQAKDFWHHYAVVTGKEVPLDRSETPFSCAC